VRDRIITEIRRLAAANSGLPPGFRTFENETGVSPADWRGVYWARWGDAVAEAGFAPNSALPKHEADFLLGKFAEACRHFGKVPSAMDFRIYGRTRPDFPNHKTVYRHFQSTANMLRQLADWAKERPDYADVFTMVERHAASEENDDGKQPSEGVVYLIRWGAHYKIGRGDSLSSASSK
jgi:hypothetical protein